MGKSIMHQNSVPEVPVYNGEFSCPIPRNDIFARRQWFFEKAYIDSSWSSDIPFADRFFKGYGLEQYQYFKGEKDCPDCFLKGEASIWWEMENSHFHFKPRAPYIEPFILYFRDWVAEKAAGNEGHNLETMGNPWINRYLKEAPI